MILDVYTHIIGVYICICTYIKRDKHITPGLRYKIPVASDPAPGKS